MAEITARVLPTTVAAPENSQPRAKAPSSPAQAQGAPTPAVQGIQDANGANTAVKAPQSDDQAQRLETLARKERSLQRQAQELKAQRTQWEQAQASAKPTGPAWDKKAFLSDPLAYGLTADELSQTTLGALQQDPASQRIRQLEAQIAKLEAGQQTITQNAAQAQTQAYEQARKQIDAEAKALVNTNDAYEAIRADGAHEAVTALIERTYEEDGVLMSVEEAAQEVENYLVERAMSYTRLKKIQAKISPAAEAASAALLQQKQMPATALTRQSPTLTNSLVTQSKPSTARERRERAILAYQGKLAG